MNTLRIRLSEFDDPAQPLPWALHDGAGQLLDSGVAAPAHWPAARRLEVILAAGHTRFERVTLPAKLPADPRRLIGAALEERLASDPAQCRFALGARYPEGDYPVALCARRPLELLEALLDKLGRGIDHVWPEESLLPLPEPASGSAAWLEPGLTLRLSAGHALTLPAASQPLWPLLLGNLVLPQRWQWCGDQAVPDCLPGSAALQPAFDWRSAPHHGPYDFASAKRRRGTLDAAWLALPARLYRLAVLTLLAAALLAAGQGAWQQWQIAQLRAANKAALRPWLGESAPTSGGPAALARQLDRERLKRALTPQQHALAPLAALAESVGQQPLALASIDARAESLSLTLPPPDTATLASWRARLAERGYQLEVRNDSPAAATLIVYRE